MGGKKVDDLARTDLVQTLAQASPARFSSAGRVQQQQVIGRYRLGAILGSGATGTVYRAMDGARELPVALKVLHDFGSSRLAHFKSEFRLASRPSHPSLVTLFELVEDRGVWAIAMELVDGGELIDYLRPPGANDEPGEASIPRVRSALAEIITGLMALHGAGILHRDLKPSNVLVGSDGVARIADFGLAYLFDQSLSATPREAIVVGSPGYMAPEQALGHPVGPKADLYSLGVILYEALTGTLPFEGLAISVLAQKNMLEAPDPAELAPHAPEDLLALTRALLARDPDERPTLESLRARFAPTSLAAVTRSPAGEHRSLVGREDERAAVLACYDAAEGGTQVVKLAGPSGIGKSALLRGVLHDLEAERGALVLSGRCHELEAIQYKGLDGIVDELRLALGALPRGALDPVAVADAAPMFPVLADLLPIAASDGEPIPAEEKLRRGREAIVQLLATVNRRRPIVLVLDDAQWGDAPSGRLLEAILTAPEPVVRLLVLAFRDAEANESPLLLHLEAISRIDRRFEEWTVPLLPLSGARASELARQILGEGHEDTLRWIADEAQGEPFLLEQLALARSTGALGETTVEGVVLARARSFPEEAQTLLRVVCVVGSPLPEELVTGAAGVTDGRRALHALAAASMVRRTGAGPTALCYPYHDRIRSALSAAVEPEEASSIHARVASIAEPRALLPSASLTRHFELGGNLSKAAEHAERAADAAAAALAFDLAATMHARVLELEPADEGRRDRSRRGLASSLYLAGRCGEAAEAFLVAARATSDDARNLERQAVEAFLAFGHVREALEILEPLLAAEGMPYPKSQSAVLFQAAKVILQVRLHTLRRPKGRAVPDPRLVERCDMAWSAGSGLTNISPAQGLTLTLLSLVHAIRAGDIVRIARGLSFAGCGFAPGLVGIGERYLSWVGEIAEERNDDALRARRLVASGTRGFVLGDMARCVEDSARGLALATRTPTPTAWEEAIATTFTVAGHEYRGEFDKMFTHAFAAVKTSRDRGDRITEVMNVSALGATCVARHAPQELDEIIEQMRRLMADWTVPYPFWEAFRLRLMCLRALCWGDIEGALACIDEHWPQLEASHFLELPVVSSPLYGVRSAVMLEAVAARMIPARQGLRDAARSARILRRATSADARTAAAITGAAIAHHAGNSSERDRYVDQAVATAEGADMRALAAMARRARALLSGEAADVERQERLLFGLGVHDATAWARFVTPGLTPLHPALPRADR